MIDDGSGRRCVVPYRWWAPLYGGASPSPAAHLSQGGERGAHQALFAHADMGGADHTGAYDHDDSGELLGLAADPVAVAVQVEHVGADDLDVVLLDVPRPVAGAGIAVGVGDVGRDAGALIRRVARARA